ncbi:citrate synthase [Desulfotalea psychrophila]|uniref:Citrate synthase n=1 Tax=Desulfotalea psychrophila (strain LSv54 / DSM 12343) TaxID=177439 RepID=Q6APA7_DESPS|nr:citrate synthase [Desulfotalea psychrophila]CAG35817.1 probable citrate synthase [Desulfotalea psychrophila LSv54]
MSEKFATLSLDGKQYSLPIIESTTGEKAIDIRSLLKDTGHITLDRGFMNTASCFSSITYLDGDKGILNYRGYSIEDLAANCSFVEVSYLILHGELPNYQELEHFRHDMNRFALLHEDMIHFFDHFPPNASPMSILSTTINSLHNFYPEMTAKTDPYGGISVTTARLLAKVRTIAAFSYKKSNGYPLVYPSHKLNYCENFLNMMFDRPNIPYEIKPEVTAALNKLLILHADHEQNCSTSTVRLVGSAQVNLYASISAGVSALWGPLHGGANQAVIEMLEEIHESGDDYNYYIEKAKDKNDPFRLAGFGHRVYKTFDPRARIIKEACHEMLASMNVHDPLLDIAFELEERVLRDDYFISRNLYPNVDFYSGIIYRAMGIPTDMFTVMFALGRLPGWIAQWTEMHADPNTKIGRPRQIYTGYKQRAFVPMYER